MISQNENFRKCRLVFAGGTPWSADFLKLLICEGFLVVGTLTKPDSKKGRGQKMASNLVKEEAQKLKIPVLAPLSLKDPQFLSEFKKWQADLVVVVAHGKIFPKEILDLPKKGFVNFHPSLLPALRGPSPIASAILEGLSETGVSIMKLGVGMDDGPVFLRKKVKIVRGETTETLTKKLIAVGEKMLVKVLKDYLDGNLKPVPQTKKGVSFSKIILKEEGQVDWKKDEAKLIDRKIRAFGGSIKVFSNFSKNDKTKRVNFLESGGVVKSQDKKKMKVGEFEITTKNQQKSLLIKTKKDFLMVAKLQVEGKNPVFPEEFEQGYEGGKFVNF